MSGILGIVRLDGRPVEPTEPAPLLRALRHRGPDGANTWIHGPAALSQLMLHTTPESLGEQLPRVDEVSGVVITADARLDNRDQLFRGLAVPPGDRKIGDSGLILLAYRRWRERCVEYLLGDFAFAIWEPAARRLYVARDGMGLRPFYYVQTASRFVFASSANAVAVARGVKAQIDPGRVADLLVQELEGVDKVSTFFQSVYRMPPGHWGLLEDGRFSTHCYWQPKPEGTLQLADEREYVDGLEEVLVQSVEARLRCQRPVASMLSGGVDSSTISGFAARLAKLKGEPPFATFSGVSSAGEPCIESEYSSKASNQLRVDAARLSVGEVSELADGLTRVESVLEDPFDLQWVLLQLMYLAAGARGHVAVLDGIDGDGVASLTKLYPAYLARRGKVLTALREIDGQRAHFYRSPERRLLFYWHGLKPALVPNILRRANRRRTTARWVDLAIGRAAIRSDFARRAGLQERYRRYRAAAYPGLLGNLAEAHAHRLNVPYLTAGIERYGRLAAYCGVEARQPFHDRRVIDYCLSLPWNLKVRNGWTKYALRKACERVCPEQVAWRPGWEQIGWKFNFERHMQTLAPNSGLLQESKNELEDVMASTFFDDIVPAYARGESNAVERVQNVIAYLKWTRNDAVRLGLNG